MAAGLITEIQRFCLHDGPGIRTTVFCKGCNLRCTWCHNPETWSARPELQLYPEHCISCGKCTAVCPQTSDAHQAVAGRAEFAREQCTGCGRCVTECFSGARILSGRHMDAAMVVAEVAQDKPFFTDSGGGVTLSGGEPLLQTEFTAEILRGCHELGIATAIDTNLAVGWDAVAAVLPHLDLVMADLKLADSNAHRRHTGAGNKQILENLRRLGHLPDARLVVRTPVIPGVNDVPEAIRAIAGILADLPSLLYFDLLPYHPLGNAKLISLGQSPVAFHPPPEPAHMRVLAAAAAATGIKVRIAGKQVL